MPDPRQPAEMRRRLGEVAAFLFGILRARVARNSVA
jgi:hypothetical protein